MRMTAIEEGGTEYSARLSLSRGEVTLLVTNACGNRCSHCIAESGVPMDRELSSAEWTAYLGPLRERLGIQALALSGGDPLLKPGFNDIYKEAFRLFSVTLFTTGVGIDVGRLSLFRKLPPRRVIVSLYGPRGEHDGFCGRPGAFDTAVAALRALRRPETDLVVNLIVHRGNAPHLLELVRWISASELAQGVKVIALSPAGRGRTLSGLVVTNEEWMGVLDDLRGVAASLGSGPRFEVSVERHLRRRGAEGPPPMHCAVVQDSGNEFSSCLHVDSNGDIFPCVMLLRREEFRLGNVRHLDRLDIRVYRRAVASAAQRIQEDSCRACHAADSCSGGCLGYHLAGGQDHRCGDIGFDLGCPTRYQLLK